MNMDFEDDYLDILQNMEFTTLEIYRQHPDLTDFQVDKAFEGLLRVYQAEQRGKSAPTLKLGPLDQQIYESVKSVCEFHLGRPSTFENNIDKKPLENVEAIMKYLEEVEEDEEDLLLSEEEDEEYIIEFLEEEGEEGNLALFEEEGEEAGLVLFEEDEIEPIETVRTDLTIEEMVACLKRIRSSISMWTKQNGRQGYLNFVNQFKP